MTTRDLGSEGFKWFVGFVEDLGDRDLLGMVKVRIPNLHGNLLTEDLPWAQVMTSPQSASHYEVGLSPNGLEIGSMVFGFFMDGNESNIPVVVGSIPKINNNNQNEHDVSRLARGINSIQKIPFGTEPASAYGAKYPYNKTYTTKSGHAIEIDDTPGSERIHIYHKSGSYTEINSQGRKVDKVVDNNYSIVVKDNTVFIGGELNVVINGAATCKASRWNITGDVYVNGDIKATGNISDKTRAMSEDRDIFNSHTHGGSSTPDQSQ